jgi:cytochrome P450
MLSHSIIFLSKNPEILKELSTTPDRIPTFIEEILRFFPTTLTLLRQTTQDVVIAGVNIPKAALVLPLLASANRDPAHFSDPDIFSLDRKRPKSHFSFGHGIHTCIGAPLARLEMRIALEVLVENFTQIQCPPDKDLLWIDSFFVRGVTALPTTFSH